MFKYQTKVDDLTGLYKVTGTLTLPEITMDRYAHSRDDLRYSIQRAFTELVDSLIEKEFENE
tara:strand:- start:320 stop:505 length:186 start_codon:yes stop_codon:yes gene_type:complete